jgi:hypothetical protein
MIEMNDLSKKLKNIIKNWSLDGRSYVGKYMIEDNKLYKQDIDCEWKEISIDNLTRNEKVALEMCIIDGYLEQYNN